MSKHKNSGAAKVTAAPKHKDIHECPTCNVMYDCAECPICNPIDAISAEKQRKAAEKRKRKASNKQVAANAVEARIQDELLEIKHEEPVQAQPDVVNLNNPSLDIAENALTPDAQDAVEDDPQPAKGQIVDVYAETAPEQPLSELQQRIVDLDAKLAEVPVVTKSKKSSTPRYESVNTDTLKSVGITITGVFALALAAAGRVEGVTKREIKVIWREHRYAVTNDWLEDGTEPRLMVRADHSTDRMAKLNARCKALGGATEPFSESLDGLVEQVWYPRYCTAKSEEVRNDQPVFVLWDIREQARVVLG